MKKLRIAITRKQRLTEDLQKWRDDLNTMKEIYRSIDPEQTQAAFDKFLEARTLFFRFRDNWETWIYKDLMNYDHERSKEPESYYTKELRVLAWRAMLTLSGSIFPDAYDYTIDKHLPAPWYLNDAEKKKNLRIFAVAFGKAFKRVQEYLDVEVDNHTPDTPKIEKFQMHGYNIVMDNYGRPDLNNPDSSWSEDRLKNFFKQLEVATKLLKKHGFEKATKNLTINLIWDRADLRGGDYSYPTDTLNLYPLGFDQDTFIHETMHRFYFRILPDKVQKHWEDVMSNRQSAISQEHIDSFMKFYEDYFKTEYRTTKFRRKVKTDVKKLDLELSAAYQYLADHHPMYTDDIEGIKEHHKKYNLGDPISLSNISDYGSTDPYEAFAEAATIYMMKGPRALDSWTANFLRQIVKTGGAKMKAQQGLTKLKIED